MSENKNQSNIVLFFGLSFTDKQNLQQFPSLYYAIIISMDESFENNKKIFKAALEDYNSTVYLFGSRVWGSPRNNSDLDIAIDASSCAEFFEIKDKLLQSNCTYTMDFINLNTINNKALKDKVIKNGDKI